MFVSCRICCIDFFYSFMTFFFFFFKSTYVLTSMIELNKYEGQEEKKGSITLNGTEIVAMTN